MAVLEPHLQAPGHMCDRPFREPPFTLIALLVCTHGSAAGTRYAACAPSRRMQMREDLSAFSVDPASVRPRRPDLVCHSDRLRWESARMWLLCISEIASRAGPLERRFVQRLMEKNAPLLRLVSTGRPAHNESRALHWRMFSVRRSFLFHLMSAARHTAGYLYSVRVRRALL